MSLSNKVLLLGSRGPKSANISALKIAATQWLYILSGLRDGHPDVIERSPKWSWKEKEGKKLREGCSERVHYARIVSNGSGCEDVEQTIQRVTFISSIAENANPIIDQTIYRRLVRNVVIPDRSRFGLGRLDAAVLHFPVVPPRPSLWSSLKSARSIKKVQYAMETISAWFNSSSSDMPSLPAYTRVLHTASRELFRARTLWNYPRTKRPTSDDKRLEFVAKVLAGVMLGISAATATKKLANWKPPRLWNLELKERERFQQ